MTLLLYDMFVFMNRFDSIFRHVSYTPCSGCRAETTVRIVDFSHSDRVVGHNILGLKDGSGLSGTRDMSLRRATPGASSSSLEPVRKIE